MLSIAKASTALRPYVPKMLYGVVLVTMAPSTMV